MKASEGKQHQEMASSRQGSDRFEEDKREHRDRKRQQEDILSDEEPDGTSLSPAHWEG